MFLWKRRCFLTVLGAAVCASGFGQISILNATDATTGYGTASSAAAYHSDGEWSNAGKISDSTASAPIHPWDPGDNVAKGWSRFDQSNGYGAGVYRALSITLSDYRGAGGLDDFDAATSFSSLYQLEVTTPETVHQLEMKLVIPFHAILAVRGYEYFGTTTAGASLSYRVTEKGNLYRTFSGGGAIDLQSSGYSDMTHQELGDFVGFAHPVSYDMQLAYGPRTVDAIEVGLFMMVDLGTFLGGNGMSYEVELSIDSYAHNGGSIGVYAVSDMSSTSGYEFQAYDANGNRSSDFTVGLVPEPSGLAVVVIGLAFGLKSKKP